jgi:hypothetical protein
MLKPGEKFRVNAVSVGMAASDLGISTKRVYQLIRANRLLVDTTRGSLLVLTSSIEKRKAWLASRRRGGLPKVGSSQFGKLCGFASCD